MLLICGPVAKEHFALAGLAVVAGAILMSTVVIDEIPRWIWSGGACLIFVGVMQVLLFTCMLQAYGWRPSGSGGFLGGLGVLGGLGGSGTGTRTVYACKFCSVQFPSYQAAEIHEHQCAYGTNVPVPVGGAPTVLGLPVGQPVVGQPVSQAPQYGGQSTPQYY